MTKIAIDIKGCAECPFVKVEKVYTPDSFDNVHSFYCTKQKKMIAGYVERKEPKVPDWCPIKIDEL